MPLIIMKNGNLKMEYDNAKLKLGSALRFLFSIMLYERTQH